MFQKYISDVIGTLSETFSSEGGFVFKLSPPTTFSGIEQGYVVLFLDESKNAYITDSQGNTQPFSSIASISGSVVSYVDAALSTFHQGMKWGYLNSSSSAQSLYGYIIDASITPIELSLPSNPSIGDTVGIKVISLLHNITLTRNNSKIFGRTEDLEVDIADAGFIMLFTGTTEGWTVATELYGQDIAQTFLNNYSVQFDGVDDYISAAHTTSLNFGLSDFSVSVWFKADEEGLNITQTMVSKMWDNISTTGTPGWSVTLNSSGRVQVYLGDDNNSNTEAPETYQMSLIDYRDGMWHNTIAVINRGADSLNIYLDGVLKNTFDISTWATTFDSTYPLFMGANYNKGATPDGYFKGYLDEVSVFSKALSLEQVEAVYGNGLASDLSAFTNLVAWYRMGDGDSFPVISDRSGHSVDMTLYNMTPDSILPTVSY